MEQNLKYFQTQKYKELLIICACEAKADIGLPVADYDDYDDDYDDYDPGIKCTKLA